MCEDFKPIISMNSTRSIALAPIGLFEAISSAILLLFITNIIPFYFKTWFVEPTGNISIAPFFGFVAAIGVLFRKNWARQGAIVLSVFIAAVSAVLLVENPEKPGFWIVSAMNALLLCLLIFSARLKQYVS